MGPHEIRKQIWAEIMEQLNPLMDETTTWPASLSRIVCTVVQKHERNTVLPVELVHSLFDSFVEETRQHRQRHSTKMKQEDYTEALRQVRDCLNRLDESIENQLRKIKSKS